MIPFLKETAKALLDSGRDLKDIRLVLPNRRAGLFFTKYLGELIDQPVWMPEVLTIDLQMSSPWYLNSMRSTGNCKRILSLLIAFSIGAS
jgi:hypothetical protein